MQQISQKPKKRFVFVLLSNFSMLSFSCAIESLRNANRVLNQNYYAWQIASTDGQPVTCSNGITFQAETKLDFLERNDVAMICGGLNIKDEVSKALLTWIRREARRGHVLGGLCTGSYALAKAGVLDGRKATIHWENQDSFEEEFPDVELTKSVFTIDEKFITTAGGVSALDMMLKHFAQEHSEKMANIVADQQIYTSIRTDQDSQRLSIPTRIGVRHPKLSSVVKMMQQNIEEPISPTVLASEVGMSTRQLERLFRRYLNRSPKRYYIELRLQKARSLLIQTDMSVINVALACGFSSPSHFSKCYRTQYMTTPYRERGVQAGRSAI